jgi:hypothetical protein
MKRMTREEVVAKKIADVISDLRFDIVDIAYYIAQLSPRVTVNRIILLGEMLEWEKEERNDII